MNLGFWHSVKKANEHKDLLNDKEQRFVEDIHRRGQSYKLWPRQKGYLSSIMRKIEAAKKTESHGLKRVGKTIHDEKSPIDRQD